MIPPPSWEVFKECDKCGTDAGKPCYDLTKSTSRRLVPAKLPHRGRKRDRLV